MKSRRQADDRHKFFAYDHKVPLLVVFQNVIGGSILIVFRASALP